MNGLRGMPFSASSSTPGMNRDPDGSTPTRDHSADPTFPSASVSAQTFATDWIEKG